LFQIVAGDYSFLLYKIAKVLNKNFFVMFPSIFNFEGRNNIFLFQPYFRRDLLTSGRIFKFCIM